jgi:protein-L-isoaspartate(D-aspartate) O-methyltransferase
MTTTDTYRHKGLRNKLVQTLKQKGITDGRVLNAIGRVPRHLFIESGFVNFAYQDKAFPIGAGQTISQPYTVAFQTQLLELKGGEKVLEIGTGSGYQAAVLLEMDADLYSIERQSELYNKTSKLLRSLGYKGRFFLGDGYKGLPAHVPFDKILITAGAPFIPKDLLLQLKTGGSLVIPLGEKEQVMTKIVRISDNDFEQTEYGKCAFVPMLEGVVK